MTEPDICCVSHWRDEVVELIKRQGIDYAALRAVNPSLHAELIQAEMRIGAMVGEIVKIEDLTAVLLDWRRVVLKIQRGGEART